MTEPPHVVYTGRHAKISHQGVSCLCFRLFKDSIRFTASSQIQFVPQPLLVEYFSPRRFLPLFPLLQRFNSLSAFGGVKHSPWATTSPPKPLHYNFHSLRLFSFLFYFFRFLFPFFSTSFVSSLSFRFFEFTNQRFLFLLFSLSFLFYFFRYFPFVSFLQVYESTNLDARK